MTLLAIYSHGPGRIKAPGRIFALVSFSISVISPSGNFLVPWLLQIVIFVFWGYKNYHIYVFSLELTLGLEHSSLFWMH